MAENKCILLTVDGANGYFPKEFVEEAVKKQIPKEPDYEGDGYDDNGEIIYDTAYCPCCRHEFEAYYDITDYCPDCGQALDWSDGERKENET